MSARTDAALPAASAPPRPLDRALFPLLVALLVSLMTSITVVGVVTGLLIVVSVLRLFDPTSRARDRAPLRWPLLAFAALTLVSALASDHPRAALYESKQLLGIPLFLAAVNGFRGGDDVRRALRWLFAVTALVSLHALAQVWACTAHAALPEWVAWALRVKLEACRASPMFRAKAFFSIYMTLGGSLLIVLTLLLARLAVPRLRPSALEIVAGVLAALALALTYVRNAWLGLGAAVVVLSGLTRRFTLLLGLVLAVGLALSVPSGFQRRALSIVDPADPTARERFYFWQAGWRMTRQAPLLGLGPGGVKRHYPEYRDPAARRPATGHLHNNLVQIAAERGGLGLAAWLAIWIGFFAEAIRIYRSLPAARAADRALTAGSVAAVAGFLVAGLFEYNFGDSEVIDLTWVVMAFPFAVDPARALAPHQE
jgi:O-antigen ligase